MTEKKEEENKMRSLWDVAPCTSSLVGADRHFTGVYCFHHQGSDETQGSHFHTRRRENLISHKNKIKE
jgi:hypothetical protein